MIKMVTLLIWKDVAIPILEVHLLELWITQFTPMKPLVTGLKKYWIMKELNGYQITIQFLVYSDKIKPRIEWLPDKIIIKRIYRNRYFSMQEGLALQNTYKQTAWILLKMRQNTHFVNKFAAKLNYLNDFDENI